MGRTAGSYERAQPLTATHTSRSISNSNTFFQQLLPLSIPSPQTLPLPIRLPTHPGHAATHSSTNSVLHKSSLHRLLTNSLYHSQIHPNSDNKILSPSPVPPTPRSASPILPGHLGQSPRYPLSIQALCLQLQDHLRPLLNTPAHTEAKVNSFWDPFCKCPKEEPIKDRCLQLPLQPNHVSADTVPHAKHPFLRHNGVDHFGPALSNSLLLPGHHDLPFL